NREKGKDRVQAALDGSQEIMFAALAATVAIIAIFLPVAFMNGVIGKYFMQFGITLSAAVALSLVEALTLTPMRCSQFLKVEKRKTRIGRAVESSFEGCANLYKKWLPTILNFPMITVLCAFMIFLGTLFFGTRLKQEFTPAQDQSRLMIRLQAPLGASLAFTDKKMQELEQYLAARPEVEGYFSTVGHGDANSGDIFLTLKPPRQRKLSAQQLAQVYRKDFKKITEAKITIQDPSQAALGGRRSSPVQFTIRGPDWNKLAEFSQKMMAAMEDTNMMTDIDSNYKEGVPEIQVIPDRIKALRFGVDVSEISQAVNVMMSSAIAGKFSQGGRRYDVRVGLSPSDRDSVDVLKNLLVRNNRGELTALSNVVDLKQKASLQTISREDRQRAINVKANMALNSSQAEAITAVSKIAKDILPPGYYAVASGSAKTFQESFQGLIFALFLGILVSYMVLASQFNSFIHPITILMALPFSLSGAFMALYFGGQSLNIYSMIGLILLMGIVKKNSILLVEFTNQMRKQGLGVNDALIEACPIRLRPILMTSLATIAGAIPPALAIGPGAESRIPMALAVIGGVIVSTLLTLFVVPCVYKLFEKIFGAKNINIV
ncbi:MAG: efflux RND transporter permease subunit, partial [Pseudomonadota bacterium]